jgi:hypothetical protein
MIVDMLFEICNNLYINTDDGYLPETRFSSLLNTSPRS